jgi:hypothetical protein
VRVQGVVLEYHCNITVARRNIIDDVAIDPDLAAADLLQPRDHSQRRRLAATGRPDQHYELMIGDVQIDALHRLDAAFIFLDDLADRDFSHGIFVSSVKVSAGVNRPPQTDQPLVAPAVRPAT